MHSDQPARAAWRRSSCSNGQGGCVEVDDSRPGAVRDSKDPHGPASSSRRRRGSRSCRPFAPASSATSDRSE
ncbi:DUF397 domain-containing protein [Kitasatospora purpeofusca]|uniref:DUF397 domain-containing protein n=1 Tax=Kitasatospora purpeofusca TaxID=67352 RepID=UPI003F4AE6CC